MKKKELVVLVVQVILSITPIGQEYALGDMSDNE